VSSDANKTTKGEDGVEGGKKGGQQERPNSSVERHCWQGGAIKIPNSAEGRLPEERRSERGGILGVKARCQRVEKTTSLQG